VTNITSDAILAADQRPGATWHVGPKTRLTTSQPVNHLTRMERFFQ
jgi:hypothetical protein